MYHSPRPQKTPNELVLSKEKISRTPTKYQTKHRELSKFVFHTSTLSFLEMRIIFTITSATPGTSKEPQYFRHYTFRSCICSHLGGDCFKAGKITCPVPNRKGDTKKSLKINKYQINPYSKLHNTSNLKSF